MALVQVQDPQYAGVNTVGIRSEGHLPQAAFQKPIWDELLYQQCGPFWMSFFLENYAGVGDPVGANEVNWAEDGKWYEKQTVHSVLSGAGTQVIVVKLKETEQYFIVNDVIYFGLLLAGSNVLNVMGRVTDTGTDSGTQTITVELMTSASVYEAYDGSEFVEDMEVALITNYQGECFEIPEGRLHDPEPFSNALCKISNTYETCDDAANRMLWFKVGGDFYWMHEEEQGTQTAHARAVDGALLWGQAHTFTDTNGPGVAGMGIIPFLDSGALTRSFAGSLVEEDIQDMLTAMGVYSKFQEWTMFCGSKMHSDLQKALKDYHSNASVWYGPFNSGGNAIGINVNKYQFGANTLNVMEYKGFSDPDFLPSNAEGFDYSNFGMLLSLQGDSIKIRYKKRALGGVIKRWLSIQNGPTFNNDGAPVQQRKACFTSNYTTHVGVQVKGLNNHGLLYGTTG